MEESSTERFLRLMNEQNARIAAEEANKAAPPTTDPIREQRQEERREKYGQLRARKRPKKKTSHVTNAFGYVDVNPGPTE